MGRLRSIPHADSIIKTSKYLLNCDEVKQITCTHLEIGCGKGDFIISKASQESKNSFIGVEKYATVLLKAIRKLDKIPTHLKNIKFIHNDFSEIWKLFTKESINTIYLNFSDPWPKKRHEKYRLTNSDFLKKYYEILKPEGEIEIKTDNTSLYEYSLEVLKTMKKKFTIIAHTKDLYNNSKMLENNIPTEYETKFRLQNKKITKILIRKKVSIK